MSIDDQISAFAAQLDRWFADFAAKLLQPGDETAEIKTRVVELELLKQFDELRAKAWHRLRLCQISPTSLPRVNALRRCYVVSNVPPG